MVDVNELRIGNWLTGPHGKFQVLAIYPYKIAYKIANKLGEFNYYLKEDCNPLPVTKELLLSIGFTETKWEDSVYENEYGDSLEFIEADDERPAYVNYFTAQNYDYSVKAVYVHQLQNLYFALNDKELPIELVALH